MLHTENILLHMHVGCTFGYNLKNSMNAVLVQKISK